MSARGWRRSSDRALSADVDARYASAAEFLQAVNRAAETGPREPVGGLGPGGRPVAPRLPP